MSDSREQSTNIRGKKRTSTSLDRCLYDYAIVVPSAYPYNNHRTNRNVRHSSVSLFVLVCMLFATLNTIV